VKRTLESLQRSVEQLKADNHYAIGLIAHMVQLLRKGMPLHDGCSLCRTASSIVLGFNYETLPPLAETHPAKPSPGGG
jgi:hypothetical protein